MNNPSHPYSSSQQSSAYTQYNTPTTAHPSSSSASTPHHQPIPRHSWQTSSINSAASPSISFQPQQQQEYSSQPQYHQQQHYTSLDPPLTRILSDQHTLRLQLKDLEARLASGGGAASTPATLSSTQVASQVDHYLQQHLEPALKKTVQELLQEATLTSSQLAATDASSGHRAYSASASHHHSHIDEPISPTPSTASNLHSSTIATSSTLASTLPSVMSALTMTSGEIYAQAGPLQSRLLQCINEQNPNVLSLEREMIKLELQAERLPPTERAGVLSFLQMLQQQRDEASKQQQLRSASSFTSQSAQQHQPPSYHQPPPHQQTHQAYPSTGGLIPPSQSSTQIKYEQPPPPQLPPHLQPLQIDPWQQSQQQQFPSVSFHYQPVPMKREQTPPSTHSSQHTSSSSASTAFYMKAEPVSPHSTQSSSAASVIYGYKQPQPAAAAAAAYSPHQQQKQESKYGQQFASSSLDILQRCGFQPFDFTYRTSAVNHIKSLLRDKLKVSTSTLNNDVWHYESRYNLHGTQEWRSCVRFTVAPYGSFEGNWSDWHMIKTQATEQCAVDALRQMQQHPHFKNLFLRPLPTPDDPNPISAVRNYLRDRSQHKNRLSDERVQMTQDGRWFECQLLWGQDEVGRGVGGDKVEAKTKASIDTLHRWTQAMEHIQTLTYDQIRQQYPWIQLEQ